MQISPSSTLFSFTPLKKILPDRTDHWPCRLRSLWKGIHVSSGYKAKQISYNHEAMSKTGCNTSKVIWKTDCIQHNLFAWKKVADKNTGWTEWYQAFVLVCEVTNRFLSDLEQAITSPSPGSSARLPCCSLERDLDRADAQGWHTQFNKRGGKRDWAVWSLVEGCT